ncbi:MAG: spore coat protein U domain-containing protein [Acinetobacter sp.]
MKTLTKISLAAIAVLSSALTQAATTSASIPVSLTITKKCTISDVATNIVIPNDASNGTGTFKVTCNTPYSIATSTSNTSNAATFVKSTTNAAHTLSTQIGVDLSGTAVPVNVGTPLSQTGLTEDLYNVTAALVTAVSATTPAGFYNDTLNISVDY